MKKGKKATQEFNSQYNFQYYSGIEIETQTKLYDKDSTDPYHSNDEMIVSAEVIPFSKERLIEFTEELIAEFFPDLYDEWQLEALCVALWTENLNQYFTVEWKQGYYGDDVTGVYLSETAIEGIKYLTDIIKSAGEILDNEVEHIMINGWRRLGNDDDFRTVIEKRKKMKK